MGLKYRRRCEVSSGTARGGDRALSPMPANGGGPKAPSENAGRLTMIDCAPHWGDMRRAAIGRTADRRSVPERLYVSLNRKLRVVLDGISIVLA